MAPLSPNDPSWPRPPALMAFGAQATTTVNLFGDLLVATHNGVAGRAPDHGLGRDAADGSGAGSPRPESVIKVAAVERTRHCGLRST